MGSLTYVNAEYWEIRGGRGLQHLDVEKRWQAARILPDRSGAGPEGFSVPDCPLARMKLGPARQDEDASAQDLPPGSPRDIARYRQEFDRHDYLNSGFVATKELREILKALGRNLSDAAASILLKQIDSDGSGTVDFEEFLGGCFGIREPRPEDKPPSPHEVVYRQMLDCIYRDDLSKMRKLAVEHGIRDFVDPVTAVGLIHVAARSGGERMVLLLLELSADPNEVTDSGETPLHFAAESSHRERGRVITALLAAGADTRTRDTDSSNACLEYMYKESKASGFAWEDDREMLERLKNHRRKNFAAHGYHLMQNPMDAMFQEEQEQEQEKTHRKHHKHRRHHHHHHHHHHQQPEEQQKKTKESSSKEAKEKETTQDSLTWLKREHRKIRQAKDDVVLD